VILACTLRGIGMDEVQQREVGRARFLKLTKLERVRQPDVFGKSDDGVRWSGEGSEG
jgi:hypothetical protein